MITWNNPHRKKFTKYFRLLSDKENLLRASKVALFVGILLNLINNP
jgi:hypothetical protein